MTKSNQAGETFMLLTPTTVLKRSFTADGVIRASELIPVGVSPGTDAMRKLRDTNFSSISIMQDRKGAWMSGGGDAAVLRRRAELLTLAAIEIDLLEGSK